MSSEVYGVVKHPDSNRKTDYLIDYLSKVLFLTTLARFCLSKKADVIGGTCQVVAWIMVKT